MEINGLANIKIRLASLVKLLDDKIEDQELHNEIAEILIKVESELEFTERYMLAYNDAMHKNLKDTQYYGRIVSKTPYWHDVKANWPSYPNLKERIAIAKLNGKTE